MRFISKAQAFKKGVIKAKRTLVNTDSGPEYTTTREPYIALFQQGGATPAEVNMALERFHFAGLTERENPARRISVFDTDEVAHREGWTPEFKKEVEEALLRGQGEFYFLASAPKVEKPWPSYDEADPSRIVDTALAIGVALEHVAAYERENANRSFVLEALEQQAEDSAEVEITA